MDWSLLRFLSCLCLFIIVIKATPVHWTPIVERKANDLPTDPIEAAFKKTNQLDQIHKEKFIRIGKMLNNSLETQELELKEGNKKLEDLRRHTSHSININIDPCLYLIITTALAIVHHHR